MPGTFKTRKILIHGKTYALLKLWEKVLLSNGISDKENKYLYPDQKQLREMSIIETGVRKSMEFILNKPYKVYQRDLTAHTFSFELNNEKVFNLYCMALDEIYEDSNIKLLETDHEIIDSHYILLGELLKRLVAQILDNRNLPNPTTDNENCYLAAFSEFCRELGKTEALIYKEGVFTSEPLFGNVMTPFAEHIGKLYEWERYLKAAVNYNNIILKARNTARTCNKYFFTLINQIKQYLCIELADHLNQGDLNPDHIDYRYDTIIRNIIVKNNNTKLNRKAKIILGNSLVPAFTNEQALILASINDTNRSKLEPNESKLIKLKKLFQFMNESQLNFKAFESFDRIVASTGWTAIVLGVINLDGFKHLIKSLTTKYQSILLIDQSLLSGSLGKEIIQSGAIDLKQLDLFSDIACGYLTSLTSPKIQMQLLKWLQEDIEFLKIVENVIGLRLINIKNLPMNFQQLLNLNPKEQEIYCKSNHGEKLRGGNNNADNILSDSSSRYAIQEAVLYVNHLKGDKKMSKNLFELMADQLNNISKCNFTEKSLREMCKQYYLAEDQDSNQKSKQHDRRKNKLKNWYVDLVTEYPTLAASKKLDEINKYQVDATIGHALIEGRILCQLHKHSKYANLKQFKEFYVTFVIPDEVKLGTPQTYSYQSYWVDKKSVKHFNVNLINKPRNDGKIHILSKNGVYASSLDEFPSENLVPVKTHNTSQTDKEEVEIKKDMVEPVEVMPRPPSGDMTDWQKYTIFPAPPKTDLASKQIKFILDLKDVVDQYREEGCFCKTLIPQGITYLRQELSFIDGNMSVAELKKIIHFLSVSKDKEGEGNAAIHYKKFYDRAQRQFPDLIKQINSERINQTAVIRI